VVRLVLLGVFATPGFFGAPFKVLARAAAEVGGHDAVTLTWFGRPFITVLITHAATVAAAALPPTTLSMLPTWYKAWRTEAAPPPRGDAPPPLLAEVVMPTIGPRLSAAVRSDWAAGGAAVLHARMDAAIDAELDAAVAAAGTARRGVGRPVDLFATLSRCTTRAGLVALAGPRHAAAHGAAAERGVRDWPAVVWSVPAIFATSAVRAVRRRATARHAAAVDPLTATVRRAMHGVAPAEARTLLTHLLDAVASEGLTAAVTPTQVSSYLYGSLVGAHVNLHATAAWAVAHVATEADLTAAAVAEVDAVLAGRRAAGAGPPWTPAATGLPVLEGVVAEARRLYYTSPSVRFTRTPFAVADTRDGGAGGRHRPGWTVPGGGHPVLLSIHDATRGAAYFDDGDTFVARRFVPAGGLAHTSAEAGGHLYGYGWSPDVSVNRVEALVPLQRLLLRLYARYTVTLTDRGGHPVGAAALPPADQLWAVATAKPVRPVWVRLAPRPARG